MRSVKLLPVQDPESGTDFRLLPVGVCFGFIADPGCKNAEVQHEGSAYSA
jgi:hypothetical protein